MSKTSALRRWLREERVRIFREQWRADLTVRRAYRGCVCPDGSCFRFPCVSSAGADGQPFDGRPHPVDAYTGAQPSDGERVERERIRLNLACPDGGPHEKVFSSFHNDSNPPLWHWICALCRRQNYDRADIHPRWDDRRFRELGGVGGPTSINDPVPKEIKPS
jgi:hypothetical protein